MSNNSNLHKAKKAKNDEFFTQLSDIENELRHYRDHFKGKVVYCNCDDARESNFFKYFSMNFEFLGLKKVKSFTEPDGKVMKMGNVVWYTNIDHKKRHEKIVCIDKYDPAKYPKFDNYDAIEVGKYTNIPKDYDGVMGVPISYLMHHNPEQFEIVGTTENGLCDKALWIHPEEKHNEPFIDGKKKYTRILIRRKPVGENV